MKSVGWWVCFVGVLLGFSVAAHRSWHYHRYQTNQKGIETVMSLHDVMALADRSGMSLPAVLTQLKASGALSAIAIEETTIGDLVRDGRVTLWRGSDLMSLARLGLIGPWSPLSEALLHTQIDSKRLYIWADTPALYDTLFHLFHAEMPGRVVGMPGLQLMGLFGDTEDVLAHGVGFSPKVNQAIASYGFRLIPRLSNSVTITPHAMALKTQYMTRPLFLPVVIFEGTSVMGYPGLLGITHTLLSSRGFQMGVVEFNDQEGLPALARQAPHRVVRVHSLSEGEVDNLTTDTIIRRYVRAVKERSVGVVVFKPAMQTDAHSKAHELLPATLLSMQAVAASLTANGYHLGREWHTPPFSSPAIWEWVLMAGGVAALMGWLGMAFGLSPWIGFVGTGVTLCLYLGHSMVGHTLHDWVRVVSLLAAITLPTCLMIGVWVNGACDPHSWPWAIPLVRFLLTIAGVVMGGVYMNGVMTIPELTTGTMAFMGVKVAFVLPIGLVMLRWAQQQGTVMALRRHWESPIRWGEALLLMGGVVMVAIYLIRSGNDMAGHVSGVEISLREQLEQWFGVRPRTKELIGYPLLGLAALPFAWARRWRPFCLAVGSVALISGLNSFCHAHTPVWVSVFRSLWGGVIGFGVVGVLTLLGIAGLALKKRMRRWI